MALSSVPPACGPSQSEKRASRSSLPALWSQGQGLLHRRHTALGVKCTPFVMSRDYKSSTTQVCLPTCLGSLTVLEMLGSISPCALVPLLRSSPRLPESSLPQLPGSTSDLYRCGLENLPPSSHSLTSPRSFSQPEVLQLQPWAAGTLGGGTVVADVKAQSSNVERP